MPDGSRRGRRFLKSDRLQVSLFNLPESCWLLKIMLIIFLELLQYLFDFIDISRTFKPGTYRLVILIYLLQCVFAKQYLLIKDVQLESIAYYTGDMVWAPAGYSHFVLTRKKKNTIVSEHHCRTFYLGNFTWQFWWYLSICTNDDFHLFKSELFYQTIWNYLRGFSGISCLVLYLKHLLIVIGL